MWGRNSNGSADASLGKSSKLETTGVRRTARNGGQSVSSRLNRCRAHLLVTCLAAAVSSPAFAQLAPPPPVRQSVDANGVDLFLGTFNVTGPVLSIGSSSPQGLSYYKINAGSGWSDNLIAVMNIGGSTYTVTFNGVSDSFTLSGSTYVPTEGNGASLTFDGTSVYTYTGRDGTIAHFDKTMTGAFPYYATGGRVTDILRPDGQKLVFSYETLRYCSASKPGGMGDICTVHNNAYRISTVRNSYGYQAALSYAPIDTFDPDDPSVLPDFATWSTPDSLTLSNLAAPAGSGTVTGDGFTDGVGRRTTFRASGGHIAGVTLPGSSSEDISVGYDATSGRVTSVTTPSGATSYSSTDVSGVRTVTVTDPLSHVTTYAFNIASQRMTGITDATSKTTSMVYDGNGRLTKVTQPEGNYAQLTYDTRGNVTQKLIAPKAGSGLSNITLLAGYDASCANYVTCNEPNWTKDAKGNQTDYTYDGTHGGLLTVTRPAPTTGAVRPQTRYTYSQLQANFDKGSGIVASGEPVYRVTAIAECQTLATCAGAADEVKTTIGYGPQTAGIGNNLLPVSMSRGNGAGTLTATTAVTYDAIGNVLTIDGPLAGTGDATRYRYDANRTLIGTVSADPDGALTTYKPRAVRRTVNASTGLVTKIEAGTVDSQSDADWANFAPLETVDVTYDSSRRPVTQKLSAAATAYALTQTGYYADGSVQCVAQRMNPAVYGSLPASACTLSTQASDGPDRISKAVYDNAGRLTQAQTAVGTGDIANERTLAYTGNGKLQTLTDAENNKTTYVYDGFDRLSKTQYPSATKGAGTSNANDYEQLTYDANSNVTSRRLRDATSIAFGYDNLDRPTLKNLPGTEPDVSYSYDNLGRITSATQTGNSLSFTWDALGRNLTQVGPEGTVTSAWDLAGQRTQLTYPGTGLYVNYDYLVTGEVSKIRENGASTGIGVLATFAYDALGNRSSLTYGNGVVTSYAWDPVARLKTLTHNLTGTSSDQTATFGYNSASQITSAARTSTVYAWTGHDLNFNYTANGLNQYTAVAGASFTYDSRGNLTSDGTNSFAYTSENLLKSIGGTGSATLAYDPAMRLFEVAGTSTTRFAYDGLDLIGEYSGTNGLLRRYVHGPGMDEPLVQYEGTGTTDRRFMQADERGSIIAISDNSGSLLTANSYDEYGIPGGSNSGRFQYTGQTWLPEIGLYNYKARMYSPTLGRFMQTDPIGPDGGINIYAYAGDDSVNRFDPRGLEAAIVITAQLPIIVTGQRCEGVCNSGFPDFRIDFSGQQLYAERTGGGGGGGEATQNTCAVAAAEPGQIAYVGVSGTFAEGFGGSGGVGKFTNLQTGTTGYYYTVGVSAGEEVAESGVGGVAGSMSAFLGVGVSATAALGGLSGSVSVGSSPIPNGASAGGAVGEGAAATVSYTQVFNCTLGHQ